MSYNPTFDRTPYGKFTDESSFISIIGGSDSYLLEDEINELQWIQVNSRMETLQELCSSGYIKNDDEIHFRGSGKLDNSFYVDNFKFNVDGIITKIYSKNNYNTIKLDSPTYTGFDLVFLEAYLCVIDNNKNKIFQFGGIDNEEIDYEMLDSRISLETSRRVQLQWKLSIHPNITYLNSQNIFNDNDIVSNITNNVISPMENKDGVFYSLSDDNENIINKQVLAFPMFVVARTKDKSNILESDIIDIRPIAKTRSSSDIDDNTLFDALNRIEILEQRVNSFQTEIISDQKAYGLSMNKKTGIYTGSEDIVNGTIVTIDNYSVANNNYVVAIVNLGNNYGGQVGEYWTWQDGDKYHVCNSGDENVIFNSFDFRNDNEEIKYGYVNSNGLDGITINKDQYTFNLNNCIIYVLPMYTSTTKPSELPSIGDIFIDYDDSSFTIFNTGAKNIRLQWFVLYINHKNIELQTLELNNNTLVHDAFGKHHLKIYSNSWGVCNILLGTPIIKGYKDLDDTQKEEQMINIGEVYVEQNKDMFMINTTSYGNATLQFAVFKTAYTGTLNDITT